jgi:hypothetical protein
MQRRAAKGFGARLCHCANPGKQTIGSKRCTFVAPAVLGA